MPVGPDIAVFYPSLLHLLPVKVMGESINATTDIGTMADESRHFVDYKWMNQPHVGKELIGSMIQPDPACATVAMLGGNQRVVGMLARPLPVRCSKTDSQGVETKATLKLANVLVVDSLPCALFVSLKFSYFCSLPENIAAFDLMEDTAFMKMWGKEDFPVVCRTAPYWGGKERGDLFIGSVAWSGGASDERVSELARISAMSFGNVRNCFKCGSTDAAKLKMCGLCRKARYCSIKCQGEDWERHAAEDCVQEEESEEEEEEENQSQHGAAAARRQAPPAPPAPEAPPEPTAPHEAQLTDKQTQTVEPPREADMVEECVICFQADASHVLVPCGHKCMCANCAALAGTRRMPVCPMCRTHLTAPFHMRVIACLEY